MGAWVKLSESVNNPSLRGPPGKVENKQGQHPTLRGKRFLIFSHSSQHRLIKLLYILFIVRLKDLFWNGLHQLCHNKHYVTLNLFGRELHPCSRCLGRYLGILLSLPFVIYLYFNHSFNFESIFVLSWLLASFAIVDWASVKAGLRTGTNSMRVVSGFFLGMGSVIYLFLLPTNIILNAISLWSYGLIFAIIFYVVWCKEYNLSLKNPIAQNVRSIAMFSAMPLTVGAVPCACGTTGGCCNCCTLPGCNTTCCCSPCMICCITLPIIVVVWFLWFRKKKKPQVTKQNTSGGKTK